MVRLIRIYEFLPTSFVVVHLDIFPQDQLYIVYLAENSGVQLGSYVVSQFILLLCVYMRAYVRAYVSGNNVYLISTAHQLFATIRMARYTHIFLALA